MSTFTTLSTDGRVNAERALDIIQSNVEFDPVDFDNSWRQDESGAVALTASTKYSLDGIYNAALQLSRKNPGVRVTVEEEWDTRDADEQGKELVVYLDGKRLADEVPIMQSPDGAFIIDGLRHWTISERALIDWHHALTSQPIPAIDTVTMAIEALLEAAGIDPRAE